MKTAFELKRRFPPHTPPPKGNKAEEKNWTEMCMRKAQAHKVHHVECVSKVPNGFCGKNTACEENIEGSKAGEVGADHEAR